MTAQTPLSLSVLYEEDFVLWTEKTAELLKLKKFDEVDWEHLDLAMSSKSDMYKIWHSKQHSGFCGTRVQV